MILIPQTFNLHLAEIMQIGILQSYKHRNKCFVSKAEILSVGSLVISHTKNTHHLIPALMNVKIRYTYIFPFPKHKTIWYF